MWASSLSPCVHRLSAIVEVPTYRHLCAIWNSVPRDVGTKVESA